MKLQRIELILASAIYLFALALIYSHALRYQDRVMTISELGVATLMYLAFIVFSILIVPRTFRKRQVEVGLICTCLLFFFVWFGLATCIYLIRQEKTVWDYLMREMSLGIATATFFVLIAYESIKRGIRYVQGKDNPLIWRIVRESLLVVGGTLIIFVMMINLQQPAMAAFWMTSSLYLYILYALCTYWIIPKYQKDKSEFSRLLITAIFLSFFTYVPFGALFMQMAHVDFGIYLLIWIGLNIFALPLIYYYFTVQKNRLSQLLDLKIELGHTSAGLQFLRSQINPHFLFNILNTLYGTALQEKAEKTANGIQKLGDMMRFMLHENNQDKILLAREIEYLHNYIDIQLLRTESSSDITVEYNIQESIGNQYIAPMILIPFVENAFKHGISLQEKSWVKLSLKEQDGVLFFDIHNSIHRKNTLDPESRRSGIGLENVRQRLELLYPDRHEWSVREAAQDFYVHLTIHL